MLPASFSGHGSLKEYIVINVRRIKLMAYD
jgi:hypothetical protein